MTKNEDSIIYPAVILLPVMNNCFMIWRNVVIFQDYLNKFDDIGLEVYSHFDQYDQGVTRRIWITSLLRSS